ncbi:MAG TPA: HpcH/HpaI aldolase/citrate lyase family protein [Ramlibacter sp.]|uniref:HpcH/HpaI aldolase/citrate lyase family protein n=1 Tax=Ramlibacter sp. TaxID=1917967 RepID=UPI002D0169DC|nr:HpcH/HpaI aldolase/citrate lyase family protein [Ramlibacter sp.]HVZ42721.1 HpcH/HpaI aldolase/citrate lyase family protein [Ramlibacter sp.]
MQTPVNPFKQALKERRAQIGLWLGLGDPYAAEICAGAGFDWLLIDSEHSPNDLRSTLRIAQAIAAYPGVHAIARVPMGHGHVGQMLIKQYLDIGMQTLLVPMVDTPEQARDLVRSMRYPPDGARGMGGARASRWGAYTDYSLRANEEVCLLVQIESKEALDNIEAIAAIDGVDGLFIGPSDLSASLGYVGNNTHPEVQQIIDDAIRRISACGKAPGILTADETLARHQLALGVLFMGVGIDHRILARGTSELASKYKPAGPA